MTEPTEQSTEQPNQIDLTIGLADGDDIKVTMSGYSRGMNVLAAMNALSWPEYQEQVLHALAAHGDESVNELLQQAAEASAEGYRVIEPDQ